MKKYFLFIVAIAYALVAQCQIYNPVSWAFDSKHISGDEYELTYTANIKDGWTVYSQYLESEDGPIATSFEFDAGDHFALMGKTVEDKLNRKEGFDKIFQMNVTKYAKKAIFRQKVSIKDYSKPVKGYLTYMTCDATKCLPPTDQDFEFVLAPKTGAVEKKDNPIKIVDNTPQTPSSPVVKKNNVLTIESNNGAKPVDIQIQQPKIVSQGKTTTPKKVKPKRKTLAEKNPAVEKVAAKVKNNDILAPVSWDIAVQKVNDSYEAVYTANIEKGWTIYSQHTSDEGPVPTSFSFDPADTYTLDGAAQEEGKKKEGYDKLFDTNVIKFVKGPVTFTQKIKTTKADAPITGYLTFMTCDDSRCLPPADVDYVIFPNKSSGLIGNDATKYIAGLKPSTAAAPSTAGPSSGGMDKSGLYPSIASNVDLENPKGNCSVEQVEAPKGFMGIFILGFLGGLLALLTPCVFPMIPLTVSFFTKGSENKKKGLSNAILYGAFILGVYLLLSVPFHLLDTISPDILNEISTNVYLNIAFFVIFLFFAFSFFGYYEITLPQSWTNKSSSAEGAGGVLGIFFMALTLALVSFSCTGPILGSLLAGALSSDGGAWQLTAGMGGFGLALALPFAIFAAFPGIMNSLPSSGGWLNVVKVVLGFLELALAFKFLSNADLVSHWGILKIEVFLGIWILCALGMGAYLLGWLKFPHDSPIKKLGPIRMILGVASLAFAGYMVTGLIVDKESNTLQPLTLLSGLAPPSCYSIFYPCDCPSNLQCFKDLDAGLAYAREVNKPILIDFTGYACVNCRKMEEHVWPKKEVYDIINEDFVLISLYVDDRKKMKESVDVPRVSGGGNRTLRTYGNKWAYFETKYFKTNTQPFYALVTPDLELLNTPVGYTPDVQEYKEFLECGVNTFNKSK